MKIQKGIKESNMNKAKTKRKNGRTNKPMRAKKIEDPLSNFTAEQLDYMLYVDGLTLEEIRE